MGIAYSTDATEALNEKQDKIDELEKEVKRLKAKSSAPAVACAPVPADAIEKLKAEIERLETTTRPCTFSDAKKNEYFNLLEMWMVLEGLGPHDARTKGECDFLGGTFTMGKCDVPRTTEALGIKLMQMICERKGNPDGSRCDLFTKHLPACGGDSKYLPKDEGDEIYYCALKRLATSRETNYARSYVAPAPAPLGA